MTEQPGGEVGRTGTEIVYVPGAENHYKYDHDVVVLDARLRDYPEAHDVILEHELAHAECDTVLDHALLEARTDFRRLFRTYEKYDAVETYFEERSSDQNHSAWNRFGRGLINAVRPWWTMIMSPIAVLYRAVVSSRNRDDPHPHAGGDSE